MIAKSKILNGCEEIMSYIGVSSRQRFTKYIKEGMPARLIDKRWVAHTDNLDEFFRRLTLHREKNPPEDAE